MSDFLESLRDARRSASAVKHNFRLKYDDQNGNIYAFFESTDDVVFYFNHIKNRAHSAVSIETFICDGKAGVDNAYEFAEQSNMLKNALFFVDRDLDDFDGSQVSSSRDIFLTEFYSIENYLCTAEGFSVIWRELIKLPITDSRYSEAFKKIESGINSLSQYLLPFFAWAIGRRRSRERVVFSKIGESLSGYFDIVDLAPAPKEGMLARLQRKCSEQDGDPAPENFMSIQEELRQLGHKRWLRGKFELWYFMNSCNSIWQELVGSPISEAKRVKKNVNIDAENIFNFLSCKIVMPSGLDEYISRRLC
jgi:hypothetical protein